MLNIPNAGANGGLAAPGRIPGKADAGREIMQGGVVVNRVASANLCEPTGSVKAGN